MLNSTITIKPSTDMLERDDRVYCKGNPNFGIAGCGGVKKYYIEKLGICSCDICDIVDNGNRRPIQDLIKSGEAVNLIHELETYAIDIIDYKKLNTTNIYQFSGINSKYLPKIQKVFDHLTESLKFLNNLRSMADDKKTNDLNDTVKIQKLIQELNFKDNGRVDLYNIGNDNYKLSKLIWLSLILKNLKNKLTFHTPSLTEDLKKYTEGYINAYLNVHDDTPEMVNILTKEYIPEIARVENKNISIDLEKLSKKITCKDHLKNPNFQHSNTTPNINPNKPIQTLELELNELKLKNARLEDQKKNWIAGTYVENPNIPLDVQKLRKRVAELESIISKERTVNESDIKGLNNIIENLRSYVNTTGPRINISLDNAEKLKFEKIIAEEKRKFELAITDNKNLLAKIGELNAKLTPVELERDRLSHDIKDYKNTMDKKYDQVLKEKLDLEHKLKNTHDKGQYPEKERDMHIHTINDLSKKIKDLTDELNYEKKHHNELKTKYNLDNENLISAYQSKDNQLKVEKMKTDTLLKDNESLKYALNDLKKQSVVSSMPVVNPQVHQETRKSIFNPKEWEFEKFAGFVKDNPKNTVDVNHGTDYWDRFVKDLNRK